MNRKVWTKLDLINMPQNEFECLQISLRARAYRLLGFNWKEWIMVTRDPLTDDITIEWE